MRRFGGGASFDFGILRAIPAGAKAEQRGTGEDTGPAGAAAPAIKDCSGSPPLRVSRHARIGTRTRCRRCRNVCTVKEIYTTLQGEGAHTGHAAVFLRFAGCNLWSGLERDRDRAVCQFCDTDFVGADGPGGGKFAEAQALAHAAAKCWDLTVSEAPSPQPSPARGEGAGRACCEGVPEVARGFPSPLAGEGQGSGGHLQNPMWSHRRRAAFAVGRAPDRSATCLRLRNRHRNQRHQARTSGIDWICVSPKANAPLALTSGDELKLVPPEGATPARFEQLDFRHFFLQPMDGPDVHANTIAAARYCLAHPHWRLSLQTHKLIGLP